MPKTPYVKTHQLNVRMPIGIYDDILEIMEIEKKWNSPQQFVQDAINEKVERWKREHAVG